MGCRRWIRTIALDDVLLRKCYIKHKGYSKLLPLSYTADSNNCFDLSLTASCQRIFDG